MIHLLARKNLLLSCILDQQKLNIVFRATILKTLGRVGCFFLRIETNCVK